MEQNGYYYLCNNKPKFDSYIQEYVESDRDNSIFISIPAHIIPQDYIDCLQDKSIVRTNKLLEQIRLKIREGLIKLEDINLEELASDKSRIIASDYICKKYDLGRYNCCFRDAENPLIPARAACAYWLCCSDCFYNARNNKKVIEEYNKLCRNRRKSELK